MIDILPPSFHGTEEERLDQIERYLAEFHDTLERKLKNIDMCDLNYDLAEKVRRKANYKIQNKPSSLAYDAAQRRKKDVSFWGYEEWAPKDIIGYSGFWTYAQETSSPDYLLTFGEINLYDLPLGGDEIYYYFNLRRGYRAGTATIFSDPPGVNLVENQLRVYALNNVLVSKFVIVGKWNKSYLDLDEPLGAGVGSSAPWLQYGSS